MRIEKDRIACRMIAKAVKDDLHEAPRMMRNQYGNLVSNSIGCVLGGTVLGELWKLLIKGLPK